MAGDSKASSPPTSAQTPPSPSLWVHPSFPSVEVPPAGSSFDKNCTQFREPAAAPGDYDRLTYDALHQLCRRGRYAGKGPKAAPKTRLSTVDAVERKRASDKKDATDAAEEMPVTQDTRYRVDGLHLASDMDKEIAKDHARRQGRWMQAQWDAAIAPPSGGVDAAICAWAAVQCNKGLGDELAAVGARAHVTLGRVAQDRELGAWKKFEVSEPVHTEKPPEAIGDTRRGPHAWRSRARLVSRGYQDPDMCFLAWRRRRAA